MGETFGDLFLRTLGSSPALVERGIRHVEELQLFSAGIAEDRISDLAANVLADFLIAYTQRQSDMWAIPTVDAAPIHHVWNDERGRWVDSYERLPVDPMTGVAILLVPRWIVRRLPWINFDDYLRTDFRTFLRARFPGERTRPPKTRVAEVSRENLQLVDRYVERKERQAGQAQPDPPPLLALSPDPVGDSLLSRLKALPTGQAQAYEYQHLMLAFLNTLFEPELIDGEEQVRTASGVEIRDIVYSNNSDRPFLAFLRSNHGNLLLTFECKNKTSLEANDINQLANYLGDALGYCGVMVTRRAPSELALRKIRATYNKGTPHRVILILHDDDFEIMLELRRKGERHPVDHLQRKYRAMVQSIE